MKKILVIDDDPQNRLIIRRRLEQDRHQVIEADSGEEGLVVARSENPALIISDVMMPGMSGFQVCQAAKSDNQLKNTPFLLLTALSSTKNKIKGMDAGADDFITKPFDKAELMARVRAHLRTKSLFDELKELEALKNRLVHMIVHDLKVPAATTVGSLQLVLEQLDGNGNTLTARLRSLLENSHSSGTRLINLVENILDVNRLEEGKLPLNKKEINLGGLLENCLSLLEPQRKKYEVSFKKELPASLPMVSIDENLISRVFMNLISNSLKYTPPKGCVTIRVQFVNQHKDLECCVEDTGMGIPEEWLGKIFDKFFQVPNKNQGRAGHGLGLAFCRMAVEAHGGRIWAESKETKGSRFIFQLPVNETISKTMVASGTDGLRGRYDD